MKKEKFLIINMIVISLISSQLLYGQSFIKDIFIGIGYSDSKLTKLNSIIDSYPINDTVGFKTIKGFSDINLGFSLGFQKIKRLSIEFSYDRLSESKQYADYQTFKRHSGIIIDLSTDTEPINPWTFKDTAYLYGYKLNTGIFSFNPQYKLISTDKISVLYGIGLNFTCCNLIQDGFGILTDTFNVETKGFSETFNKRIISWQSNLTISYNVLNNFAVDLHIQYRDNRVKNIGGMDFYKNDYYKNSSNHGIYPIYNTTIDYSGINYMIRFKYIFKPKNASS